MHPMKRNLLLVNLIGGSAVLGSYVWGFSSIPNAGELLWGGVPAVLRPVYTINMFLAAAGYFFFSTFLLRQIPAATRVGKRPALPVFTVLYTIILAASALWLPLSHQAFSQSSAFYALLVKLDLAIVALSSLGLFYALFKIQPNLPAWHHVMAILGAGLFCVQTVILDAIIWSLYFPV